MKTRRYACLLLAIVMLFSLALPASILAEGPDGEEPGALPDLRVKQITWTPENPRAGDEIVITAVLENIGDAATPDGIQHSITIFENWVPLMFNSSHTASMAPGETIELVLPPWTAEAGTHNLMSWIDDVGRIEEKDEDNNYYSFSITVEEDSGEEPGGEPGEEPVYGLSPETMLGSLTAQGFTDGGAAYNLGTIFIPLVDGKITGIRVFGVAGDNGDHTASVYEVVYGEIIGGPYTIS